MGVDSHNFTIPGSVLQWWSDAGVDCAVGETPFAWLNAAKPARRKAPENTLASVSKTVDQTLPDTLEAFRQWIVTADLPEAGPPQRRVPPAGREGASLMILADFPDPDDVETKTLLSGSLAELFDRMLAALKQNRESVYVAALCPGRPVRGMIGSSALEPLRLIARHHIALVRPKQLWLMGTAPSRAILGLDDARARGQLHKINLNGCIVDVIATAHPRTFGTQKAMRVAAWTEMQRLLNGSEA